MSRGNLLPLLLKPAGKVKSAVLDGTSLAPTGGTKTVSPTDTTSYIAQCSGPGGSTVSSATVTVTPPPPPTCELTAAPKEIEQGQSSTLTLKTGGKVKSATIDGTAVSTSGGTKTVNPASSSIYIAQCSGPGGSTVGSAAVTVLPPPPPTAELTAAPKEIEQGQSSTLTLKTGGKVKSAILDGTEVPAAGGTKSVSPANTTSYIAQASGPGGSALSSATVTVMPPPAPTRWELTLPAEVSSERDRSRGQNSLVNHSALTSCENRSKMQGSTKPAVSRSRWNGSSCSRRHKISEPEKYKSLYGAGFRTGRLCNVQHNRFSNSAYRRHRLRR